MTAENQDVPHITRPRQSVELTESECWELLSRASVGRIVFTHRAMPAIRPVNHIVDRRVIIVRTHLGTAIAARASSVSAAGAEPGAVVCYEADDLDPARHTGWSVIATGFARLVRDKDLIDRYTRRLEPWIAGEMDHFIAIEPQFITGIRLMGWCA